MIPYPYNMVDMGGIDLAEANGTVVDGLYAKIVEAVNACGDIVLYNWKFAGIEIAPQHTSILIGDPIIINGAIQVTEQDEVTVPGINPERIILPLNATENGEYSASDFHADGFDPVNVSVTSSIAPLEVDQNGTYNPPSGVDGYAPVTVNVSSGGGSTTVFKDSSTWLIMQKYNNSTLKSVISQELKRNNYSPYFSYSTPLSFEDVLELLVDELFFGYELYGNVDSDVIAGFDLELLGDFSAGGSASGNSLTDAITNYRAVILNGIYNTQKTSNYNTSIFYFNPQLNTSYWTGMKDRNPAHECLVTFTDAQTVSLSGNRQVIIYGLP